MTGVRKALCLMGLLFSCHAMATSPVQVDYMLNCQGCHLPGGEGFPERGVPRLTGHLGKFLAVKGGREFLAQVPGSALSDLDDDRLAAVLNWMLRTFSSEELTPDFVAYTGDEIHLLRQTPLVNVTEVRHVLIQKISESHNEK